MRGTAFLSLDASDFPTVPASTPQQRRAFRLSLGKHEAPWTIRMLSLVFLIMSLVELLIREDRTPADIIGYALVIGFLIAASVIVGKSKFPPVFVPWMFAGGATAVITYFLIAFHAEPQTWRFGIVLVLVAIFGPYTMSWAAFWVAITVITVLAIAVGASITTQVGSAPVAVIPFLAAVMNGAVLLMVRIRSANRQADLLVFSEALATTDSLTGLLNRNGFDRAAAQLAAASIRLVQPVTVWYIDVDGLKAANDMHGHQAGDKALIATAHAIRQCARQEDVVARVGGDEFVVIGLGTIPDFHQLPDRIAERIAECGIDPARWVGTVSYGAASSLLATASLDDLVRKADAAMYEYRARKRETSR